MWTKAATKVEQLNNKMSSQNTPVENSLPTILSNSSLRGSDSHSLQGKFSYSLKGAKAVHNFLAHDDTETKPVPPPRMPDTPAPPEISDPKLPDMLKSIAKDVADGKPIAKSKIGAKASRAAPRPEKPSAWKSAAKMVGHVGIWRKGAGNDSSSSSSSQQQTRITDDELAELCKLESILLADYETYEAA